MPDEINEILGQAEAALAECLAQHRRIGQAAYVGLRHRRARRCKRNVAVFEWQNSLTHAQGIVAIVPAEREEYALASLLAALDRLRHPDLQMSFDLAARVQGAAL